MKCSSDKCVAMQVIDFSYKAKTPNYYFSAIFTPSTTFSTTNLWEETVSQETVELRKLIYLAAPRKSLCKQQKPNHNAAGTRARARYIFYHKPAVHCIVNHP